MTDTSHDLWIGEWQTATKTVPTVTLDEQGNPKLGERVVKQRYAYVPLIPHRSRSRWTMPMGRRGAARK
ncbi:MAG: hypothetical protein QOF33_2901 [Thermomicrobiales bacterium]|jgi:hypothetical protein|nr:hypothetical protein [Thermomicrobiales bacterium]